MLWFGGFILLLTEYISVNRDQIKEVVRMLGHMNALDHIITVAAELGIKDIKPLLEAKSWGGHGNGNFLIHLSLRSAHLKPPDH